MFGMVLNTPLSHKLSIYLVQMSVKIQVIREAVVQRCSVKKVFLEISQNSLEKPVPESLF